MRARRAGGRGPQEASLHCASPANGTIRLVAAKSAKRPVRRSVTAPRKARQRPMSTSGAKSTRPLLSDRRKPWTWISHSIGERGEGDRPTIERPCPPRGRAQRGSLPRRRSRASDRRAAPCRGVRRRTRPARGAGAAGAGRWVRAGGRRPQRGGARGRGPASAAGSGRWRESPPRRGGAPGLISPGAKA